MPEVLEKPATETAQPNRADDAIRGDMDFGIGENGEILEDAPSGEGQKAPETPPRDEQGRFTKAAEETPVEAPPVEEKPKEEPVTVPTEGLDLESDAAPEFGHDGKFAGGKFLGKYETIDDALVAHKHAQREINRLQLENRQLRDSPPTQVQQNPDLPYVYDPHDMTPDKMAEQIAGEIAGGKEMTSDERFEYELNPSAYIAKKTVQAMTALTRRTAVTRMWSEETRKHYTAERLIEGRKTPGMSAELYDRAYSRGHAIVGDWKKGALGPAELRVLIGMGELARDGLLSGDKEVNRKKPTGRDPVTTAATHVPVPKKTELEQNRDEAAAFLKDIQANAYS